jgi:mxaD protein
MTEIVETAHVGEPAGEVWERIGGFGVVGEWHPMLAAVKSVGEDVGCLRRTKTRDGATSIERLIDRSPEERFYRYKILSTALPVRGYVGELRVDDNGDGTSTVVFSARFEPTLKDFRTIEEVRSFFKTGLGSIVDTHRKALK